MEIFTRDGLTVLHRNKQETERIYKSIFDQRCYAFRAETDCPSIIDCGAHIGLATLYFKRRFPFADILCIEPNPTNVELLKQNVRENHLSQVQVLWGALSDRDGQVALYMDPSQTSPWSWGDTIVEDMWGANTQRATIMVPALKLSSLIQKPIDFLKVDIEGAELEVLREAASKLHFVKAAAVEVHSTRVTSPSYQMDIRRILESCGFEVTARKGDWVFLWATRR